ncbi:MAG: Hsp20/alpha crystallin family protein [Actinomycetes bacterium]
MGAVSRRETTSSPLADLMNWIESGWPNIGGWPGETSQAIRIEDRLEDDRYVVRAELPGIDPEKDVQITIADGVLSVSAERHEQVSEKGRSEFRYGSLLRRVNLPKGAQEESVVARYEDGILEISVPVAVDRPEPRSIPVSRAPSG